MKEKLQKLLKPKRYRHSLGVAETAVVLAKKHGADEEKAYTAGLLHDMAKNISKEDSLNLCRKLGIKTNEIERQNPSLLHAPLGAELIKREFGIYDMEISSAIACHTVGKANMTLLDKIIYIADMIEPSRDFPGVEKLRKLSFSDIDKAMLECLRFTLEYNIKKGSLIHPASIDAWNSLII